MSEPTPGRGLGSRLRELRSAWGITQKQLGAVLSVSTALISSWESGTATPPEERLNAYARFFATRRSLETPRLIPADDLTEAEEQARSALVDELVRLRETAEGAGPRVSETGALGGRFWYFPDGQPITILCTPLTRRQLGWSEEAADRGDLPPATQYATNPAHPNAIRNLANGDVDALLELVGHIRAENPTAQVRWFMYDRITSPTEQLVGHVVLLGGVDTEMDVTPFGDTGVITAFFTALDLPVTSAWADQDDEFGGSFHVALDADGAPTSDPEKAVTREAHPARFLRDENEPGRPRKLWRGAPRLTADVALLTRMPNPVNPGATLTSLSGIFSRGTYGAVRAFTDATFRARNEQWLQSAVDVHNFWLLFRVPVFDDTTFTPDLTLPRNRLRSSV